ncbi:hypothetical protein BHE74_00018753 [Ensete ventricosum]|nr:hypothetical protein GW17_00036448 [Ensete ventricosum]RWW73384.1 hypothetical protein BHE74_00018753 [Ensete ventricosum]RZR93284.1 hypothetical protein BHM03_00021757 [Ensete ventricosum]
MSSKGAYWRAFTKFKKKKVQVYIEPIQRYRKRAPRTTYEDRISNMERWGSNQLDL